MASVDGGDGHAHGLHDFHAVLEREDDALLGCTQQMGTAVDVEVKSVQAASHLAVLQHTLGAVAEGQYA